MILRCYIKLPLSYITPYSECYYWCKMSLHATSFHPGDGMPNSKRFFDNCFITKPRKCVVNGCAHDSAHPCINAFLSYNGRVIFLLFYFFVHTQTFFLDKCLCISGNGFGIYVCWHYVLEAKSKRLVHNFDIKLTSSCY